MMPEFGSGVEPARSLAVPVAVAASPIAVANAAHITPA
jgi:hypothetical protein